jgi:glutamate-1-semialdehyde 2,1-aminomutase
MKNIGSNVGEALRDAEQRFTKANFESHQRHLRAVGTMPGGNTRTALHYSPFPVTFVSAEGATLRDMDGHTYSDFLGEYSAGIYGHSNPTVITAATDAIQRGIVLGGPNQYEVEFAELMKRRFPSCELLRFCNSGTESNLMALVTARAVTGRAKIMVFEGAYHGGLLKFPKGGSPINVPFPLVVGQYNDTETTLPLIDRNAKELAAIIIEPMMGAGGAIAADRDFLLALREAASRHDIVLIFDEVMTSRLSPGGLQEKLGVLPDMTTFGKYLGGGFSFGAFGGARRLMERYDPYRPDSFAHAGTFNNNVATMAAGLAGLRDVYTPAAAVELSQRGDRLQAKFREVLNQRQVNMQTIGVGSLISFHFQKGPIRSPRDVNPTTELRALFHLEMMLSGYYLARRGYMALSLALQEADYDGFVEAVDRFCEKYLPLLSGR